MIKLTLLSAVLVLLFFSGCEDQRDPNKSEFDVYAESNNTFPTDVHDDNETIQGSGTDTESGTDTGTDNNSTDENSTIPAEPLPSFALPSALTPPLFPNAPSVHP